MDDALVVRAAIMPGFGSAMSTTSSRGIGPTSRRRRFGQVLALQVLHDQKRRLALEANVGDVDRVRVPGRDVNCASCRKRARASGTAASAGLIVFIATRLPISTWRPS